MSSSSLNQLPIYKNFLKKCYTNKEKKDYKDTTHVSLSIDLPGSYVITDITQFNKLYMQTLQQQQRIQKPLLFLAEKRQDISQILIDLDFQRNTNDDESVQDRLYTDFFIKVFINQYMKHLQTYIQFENQTQIFVLEKKQSYKNNGYIKDGIHIQIPSIVLPLKDQAFIRKKIINDSYVLQSYKNLNVSQPFCKCFDNSATKNLNWLLYGSQKPNNEPYFCKQIYIFDSTDQPDNSQELQGSFPGHQYQNNNEQINTIIQNNQSTSNDESDSEQGSEEYIYSTFNTQLDTYGFDNVLEKYTLQKLFLLFQVYSSQQNVQYKQLYQNELILIQQKEISKQQEQLKINKVFNESQEENIQLAQKLISILSVQRADNYDDWMHVGWCCKNISDYLQDSWIQFSQKSSKYNSNECYDKWSDFEKRDMTIASLKYWAKEDNPDLYQKIINQSVVKYVRQACNEFNHFNVALVVYHMYKGQFMYSSKQWWYFQDHRWKICDNCYILQNYLSTEVKEVFFQQLKSINLQQEQHELKQNLLAHNIQEQKVRRKYNTDQQQQSDTIDQNLECQKNYNSDQIKILDKEKKKLTFNLTKLGESTFKNGVINQSANIFKQDNPDFVNQLDNNPNLLCFNNGVYDLEKNIFRNGVPTDYITQSTNYDYLINVNKQDPIFKDIKKYMTQVFVDDSTRDYIWNLFASFLSGVKLEEKFYLMNGCGSNSKSVLLKLLSLCLGDYSTNISVTAVTGKRTQSAQANPEIAACRSSRLVIMQEPGNNDQLNIGVVKEYSGNDRIRTRQLYDNGFQFVPQFRMVLVCNHLPEVNSQDDGTWRRMLVITFKSRFCTNPDKSKNEFKIKSSADLEQKIKIWIPYFMFLLIQRYHQLPKNKPIPISSDILKDTSDYKRSNNLLLCFFLDRLVILDQQRDIPLQMNEIVQDYIQYCRIHNYTRERQSELRIFLNKQLQIQDLKNIQFFNLDFK